MTSAIKIILVEDEEYNLRLLEEMIKKVRPGWEVLKTFESVKGTVKWLRENSPPDLLFMDIQLADGLCFSVFDQVDVKSMVIFTTAYDNYALRAFKVNSIDYLLKPFKEKDLETAVEKFESFRFLSGREVTIHDYSEIIESIRRGEKKYRKRFLVSRGAGFYSLISDDVAYFFSESRITTAVTFRKQNHIVDFSLEVLEEELDPDIFFRANRKLIVNINSVERVDNYFRGKLKIRLNPPFHDEVAVSRLKAMDFKKWLGK
ncbi:MAG: LytTR family DNA-binding domain-containing protein [Prolixibacteraceae bacterium]|jgi:DNA-binding LytR/AlgR family response regulator|nr:LytTR family DNA-binding domain-containing protein [Prolixibacteraceae bacterium]NLO03524.1 response regulator transcription factor [Bacteroidales bacterium]